MRGAYVAGGERQRGGVGTLDRPDEDGGAVKVRCVANRCRPNGGAERRARHLDLKAKRERTDGKLERGGYTHVGAKSFGREKLLLSHTQID